ncbi:hypothetical protein ACG04R_02930 [Roseateles sp. BYS78W]|uniref:DUF3618 domain-containing protein n=1 Tax=Pelomonas candidula TaxID=3299025 RepID=A0ABW7H6S5_9BURK
MIPTIPDDPRLRDERKANLLLASELLRGQVGRDVDDLGERADAVVHRVLVVRGWLSDPTVLAAAGGAAAFFATAGQKRRGKLLGALRWAWLAWRIWRRR